MTVSNYWQRVSCVDYELDLECDNPKMTFTAFRSGVCHLSNDWRVNHRDEIKVSNLPEFITIMQEAHDLAKAHFGSEWGVTNDTN